MILTINPIVYLGSRKSRRAWHAPENGGRNENRISILSTSLEFLFPLKFRRLPIHAQLAPASLCFDESAIIGKFDERVRNLQRESSKRSGTSSAQTTNVAGIGKIFFHQGRNRAEDGIKQLRTRGRSFSKSTDKNPFRRSEENQLCPWPCRGRTRVGAIV